uniref:Sterile alpha motif domain containing 9 like n=1 Tax=Tetraodon nigroviridis TaxID=99883 RepID=H3DKV7_TETNG
CRPRPFDQEATDFVYVKHRVLQPESGAFNLISPCHEYKSFLTAATLDRTRLQAKFAREVLKFAIGCMNIRSNGTIHFGVADSKESTDYTHGEIIGIPVEEKDIYVDTLNYIERCVPTDSSHVHQCVRSPRFIEVMDQKGTEKSFVVEVDVVPSLSIVKNKVYAVRLPNFKESTNKVEFEKKQVLRRVGASTNPVLEEGLSEFYERVRHRDAQREEAERSELHHRPESCQNLGRKLTMLMMSGKKLIEKDKWFILVTSKFKPEDLGKVDWLLNMNMFCVFDLRDQNDFTICKQILPKGTFQVIFLLTSPVEKPLLYTFNEFYTDMGGHEDIICICEAQEDFQKWRSFAEGLCGSQTVDDGCVVGMRMSHINATLQQIQPVQACVRKHLPVFFKGTCDLKTRDEEQMYSLEILTKNHCEETSEDFIEEEKVNIEQQFYHGGKVEWLNFWLAEHGFVGEVIKRDAYQEVSHLLNDVLKPNSAQRLVNIINIFHHPGSGGSTVARQVLWDNRKDIRCAVIKPSNTVAIVAEHAVKLREYDEKDIQRCLPVLLLIEDSDKEYLDDLRNELEVAIYSRKVQNETCFILLSCRRSHEPEKKCRESPLMNVSVTHKLSAQEKREFSGKRKDLEDKYDPDFILTFVLLSEEFNEEYVKSFVEHLLLGIEDKSVTTRLIRYVALLNTYVQGSFISQSHCEALLGLNIYMEGFRQHEFEQSLSPQARLVFLHLRDEKTHINSISIIHPLVAQEILQQLLRDQQTQSSLAMELLHENDLFEHRFGRFEYQSFLKDLFNKRARIIKGDGYDSAFAPLIEHVCDIEKNPEKAIQLLEEAFQQFREDAFIAQTLARLHYTYKMFEQAEHWAETATKKQPNNSCLLDTKGQVYKKWF